MTIATLEPLVKVRTEPTLEWDSCSNSQSHADDALDRIISGDVDFYAAEQFEALANWDKQRGFGKEELDKFLKTKGSSLDKLEEHLFNDACSDDDQNQWDWNDLCEDLTYWMKDVWPKPSRKRWSFGNWRAEGQNLGWRHQDGAKDFRAETGSELLRACLPDTECSFTITRRLHRDGGSITIVNSHHDAMGEVYFITPRKG